MLGLPGPAVAGSYTSTHRLRSSGANEKSAMHGTTHRKLTCVARLARAICSAASRMTANTCLFDSATSSAWAAARMSNVRACWGKAGAGEGVNYFCLAIQQEMRWPPAAGTTTVLTCRSAIHFSADTATCHAQPRHNINQQLCRSCHCLQLSPTLPVGGKPQSPAAAAAHTIASDPRPAHCLDRGLVQAGRDGAPAGAEAHRGTANRTGPWPLEPLLQLHAPNPIPKAAGHA